MTGCAVRRVIACSGIGSWGRRRQRGNTTTGRRDKSGSPVEPQAIGMAWVRPCRSVVARAAPKAFTNEFNSAFGTVRDFTLAEPLP
jgi:hypothetical protein